MLETAGKIRAPTPPNTPLPPLLISNGVSFTGICGLIPMWSRTLKEPIIVFHVVSDDLIAYMHTLYE